MSNKIKKTEKLKKKKVSIGGQAVLEGVMMRGEKSVALAVRDEDGVIRLETTRVTPPSKRNKFFRLPIVRGVYSFVQSLVSGVTYLMRSAEVYGEGEPSKFEKWLAKKLKINIMNVVAGISLILGLALAVFLFIWLPSFVRGLLEKGFNGGAPFNVWAKNFIEGGLKLAIFIAYLLLCSLLKDIRRTYKYHGAEHKTISCYEKGLPLTVENAKKCTRIHDRCGTTFIVFVLVISILLFACFEALVGKDVINGALRVLCKIALLPVVAGLSYELLKCLAKTSSPLVLPLKFPGMLLQRITTSEPDEKMLEVAIASFNAVLEMDADESIPEKRFTVAKKCNELTLEVKQKLSENGIIESAEAEWIVSLSLNIKRDEVYGDKYVSPSNVDKINKLTEERITGRPLWYCIGDTDFYGYKIKVDERVLIPRPETEILVENALKTISSESSVLDLCTGSGAIAIAVKKQSNAKVLAVDISSQALALAKENATINDADIEFIESDMFSNLSGRKFDVIISNPPYIKSADMISLQREVKDFEPSVALDGGEDGLKFYRIIAQNAREYLNENGSLIMEIGFDEGERVIELFKDAKSKTVIKDYEGKDRIVKVVF